MLNNRFLRYTLFALLYFTQGTVLSYFTSLNALYLLGRGVTLTNIGIFGTIAMIPFVLKIFLGMLSDRINLFGMGYRKPYIIIGLFIQAACLVAVPFIDPGKNFALFVALAFTLQLGMALYDTCTDGLALDTTPQAESSLIQGFMVGGRAVGVIVTASVVGLLADKASWNAVFWLLAGLTLIPLPLVLAAREAPRPQVRQFEWKAFGAFKKVSVIALAGLGLLFFLIIAGANQLVNPYLTERFQISLSTAGLVTTVWGLGVITGSLAGGYIMRRVGDKVITWITMAIGVVALGFLAFVPSLPLMWVAAALFGLCYGTYQTVYFALAMKNTDQRIAASMFAILMAVSNIGQAIGMGLGGALAENSSYQMAFLVLAAVNILVIPLMPLIFRKSSSSIPVA